MASPVSLLVSGDPALVETVQSVFAAGSRGELDVVVDAERATARLEAGGVSLVAVHLEPGPTGATRQKWLEELATNRKGITTIAIAEEHVVEQAIGLLRAGVAEYLTRPLDVDRFAFLVDALVADPATHTSGAARSADRIQTLGEQDPFIYLASSPMGPVMEQVKAAAQHEATVLLTGETGTGKTRLARLIHELSPRRDQPFLVVNCGALSASLIESEMFGHLKGAFTGSNRNRVGKFAEVGRGTILLDEIDSLPLGAQSKFLRVLEEREFEPVGSNTSIRVRARIIVASNRSLEQEVGAGRFRSDLFYRLNVVSFHMQPLRECRSVIPMMAEKFIVEFARRYRRKIDGLTSEAEEALLQHSWPGNVRELRNVMERAVVLSAGPRIRIEDLAHILRPIFPATIKAEPVLSADPFSVPETRRTPSPSPGQTLRAIKRDAEIGVILRALEKHGNNRRRAAMELGISRVALYKKLHKYGMMRPRRATTESQSVTITRELTESPRPVVQTSDSRTATQHTWDPQTTLENEVCSESRYAS